MRRPVTVVLALALASCGTAKLSLLPPISTNSPRDPNPLRPLVETPADQPGREDYSQSAATAAIGPVAGGTTAAAALVFLFGGKRPALGIFGTFDENALFEKPKPRAPATEP